MVVADQDGDCGLRFCTSKADACSKSIGFTEVESCHPLDTAQSARVDIPSTARAESPTSYRGSAFQSPTDEEIASDKDPLAMRGYILAWAHRIDGKPKFAPRLDGSGGTASAPVGEGGRFQETMTSQAEACFTTGTQT